MSDLLSCTTKLDEATCLIHVLCCITGMQGLMEWSIPRIPSSRLVAHVSYTCAFRMRDIRRMTFSIQDEHVMGCDVVMFCHTCAFRMTNMRGKDTLNSNGGCLRLDVVHAVAWCMDTISIVNGNVRGRFRDVLAWKVLFCRYTNHVGEIAKRRVDPTSYYRESRL
jgi:hypothetical protein